MDAKSKRSIIVFIAFLFVIGAIYTYSGNTDLMLGLAIGFGFGTLVIRFIG